MSYKFDVSVFKRDLNTQWLGQSMLYFKELDSTNSYLKKLDGGKVDHGMICLTDNQMRGRGQYERKWETEKGRNLTFSLVFKPNSHQGLHVLTLACALALVEHLNACIGSEPAASIKWPNDVILNDKKVAGLLTETVFNGNNIDRLVIGIGINVNQERFSTELSGKATSVYIESDKTITRELFLGDLLSRMEYKYRLWHRRQPDLLKSINRNIIGYGQWIGVIVNGKMRDETYKLIGIDESGQLLMLDQEGGIESFSYEQIRLVTN